MTSRLEEEPPSDIVEWMTTSEVARLCGVEAKSIRRYVDRGVIPTPARKGGILLFRRSEIEPWADRRRGPGRPRKGSIEAVSK